MKRRKRLRKKLHRRHLDWIVADVSNDPEWRERLLAAAPAESLEITAGPTRSSNRLIRWWGLRYRVAVADRIGPKTAVLVFWASEFPVVNSDSIIFSMADLSLTVEGKTIEPL